MSKYRIIMSVTVEASSYREAYENAKQLAELLDSPVVRMGVQSKGIRLCEEQAVVHRPLLERGVGA